MGVQVGSESASGGESGGDGVVPKACDRLRTSLLTPETVSGRDFQGLGHRRLRTEAEYDNKS